MLPLYLVVTGIIQAFLFVQAVVSGDLVEMESAKVDWPLSVKEC